MSDIVSAVSKIGGAGGSPWGALIPAVTTGLGLYGNIKNDRQRQAEIDRLNAAQKAGPQTPAQYAQLVAQATQPLSQGLTQGVGNQVNAMMAERGLAQAPGIFAGTMAQSLAPYEQANQQQAMQIVAAQLGLPLEYANAILGGVPKSTNLSPSLMMMMQALAKKAPGATPDALQLSGNEPSRDLSGSTGAGPFPFDISLGLPPAPTPDYSSFPSPTYNPLSWSPAGG